MPLQMLCQTLSVLSQEPALICMVCGVRVEFSLMFTSALLDFVGVQLGQLAVSLVHMLLPSKRCFCCVANVGDQSP